MSKCLHLHRVVLAILVGSLAAAQASAYVIQGYVKNSTGGGLSGWSVNLTGTTSASTTSSGTGFYSFVVNNGTYTVTPTKSGWTCSPVSRTTTISGASVTLGDFACSSTPSTYSVQGYVKNSSGAGLSGWTVNLSGAASSSTTTGSSGLYNFPGLANGSYTVAPSKSGWTCSPLSRNTTISGSSVTLGDFVCTQNPSSSIQGYVKNDTGGGLSGWTVNLSGAASSSTTTGSSGLYNFPGLANGSYTVTPSKSGWTCSPLSRNTTISGSSVTLGDFVCTQNPSSSIQGYVKNTTGGGLSGWTVNLSGSASSSTTTGSSGLYNFPGLANGSYTVTPSKSGWTCTPLSRSTTISGSSVTLGDFTCSQDPTLSIQGYVKNSSGGGLTGWTVALTGAASSSTTTSASGLYNFPGLADGSYTVTPTKSGWVCNPASRSTTLSGSPATLGDFVCSQSPTTGDLSVIVLNQAANSVNGAVVECYLTGTSTSCPAPNASQTTNASGLATFANLAPATYDFKAKVTGSNPFDSLPELWNKSTKVVVVGANTLTMTRNQPYTETLRIYRVSDGTEVIPGATVAPNTQLQIRGLVRNGTTGALSSRVRFLIDQNQAAAWDFDNTTAYQNVPGSSGTVTFTFNFTPTATGTYSYVDRTEVTPDGKTDSWNWGANNFIVSNGSLTVTVQDHLSAPKSGALVECYLTGTSTPCPVPNGSQTTNGAGQATFSNLSPATYDFKAKVTGANPFDSTPELWNKSTKVVAVGANTLTMTRNQPYTETLRIYRLSDGAEVIPGATVAPNTQLQIRGLVRNGTTGALSSRVRFLIDRNQAASWDFDNTAAYQNVPGSSGSVTFTFNFTPTATGTYSYVDRTEVTPDGKTDAWNWGANNFTVGTSLPDLKATVLDFLPSPVAPGGKLVVRVRLENLPGGAASPAAAYRALLSTSSDPTDFSGQALTAWQGAEREANPAQVPPLAPGDYLDLYLAFAVTSVEGTDFWIKTKIDPDPSPAGAIPERDEVNNVGVSQGQVRVIPPSPGVTVITHGFDLDLGANTFPRWARTMAEAIRRRAGAGSVLVYNKSGNPRWTSYGEEFVSTGRYSGFTRFWQDSSPSAPGVGEAVLIFDWATESDFPGEGWSEAAADALVAALVEGQSNNMFSASQLSELHLIGHSRGTVVTSEAAERLLAAGYPVRQVTYLDPHDWGDGFGDWTDFRVNELHSDQYPPRPQTPEIVDGIVGWNGVSLIDSYFQDSFWNPAELSGRRVENATNVQLPDGFGHGNVHVWYHGTIDPDPKVVTDGDTPDDGDTINSDGTWYSSSGGPGACVDSRVDRYRRRFDGYYFSRVSLWSGECLRSQGPAQQFALGPSGPENLLNGDFRFPTYSSANTILENPGWSQHGGAGIVVQPYDQGRNFAMLLDSVWSSVPKKATHNRLLVPPSVEYLTLLTQRSEGCTDVDDKLEVRIGEAPIGAAVGGLCSLPGWQQRTWVVPQELRGSIGELTLEIVSFGAGGASIAVDDISWVSGSPLPAPTNLTTSLPTGPSTISLGWIDNATNEEDYVVESAIDAGGFAFRAVTAPFSGAATWSDSGLQPCTTYRYRTYARRGSFPSPFSNEASATTTGCMLDAPMHLTATTVLSNLAGLTWSDVIGETGYILQKRLTGTGSWSTVGTTAANEVALSATGLVACTDYDFQVLATNGPTNSNPSTALSVRTTGCTSAPATPAGFSASAVSTGAISLQWQDVSDESEYRIERKTGAGGAWGAIATVPMNATAFLNDLLAACTTYYYQVAAANSAGPSPFAAARYATTLGCVTTPNAPANLRLTASTASPTITLQWDDSSANETGFRIERKSGAGAFAEIGTTSADQGLVDDATVATCTSYTYRVRAYNASGTSAYSNEASVTSSGCQIGIQVDPSSIDFGGVNLGLSTDRVFMVTNTGTSTLNGSASTTAPFSVVAGGTYSVPVGQSQFVTARFTPSALQQYSGQVTFSGGGGAQAYVWGTGASVASPILSVSPGSLDFGEVASGQIGTASFTVQNTGSGTLAGNATSSGAPFAVVSGTPYSLGPGQSVVVQVQYSPLSESEVEGVISFTGAGTVQRLVRGGRAFEPLFADGFESGDQSAWVQVVPPSTAALVGYWPFDSDSNDHSGNGNNGTWSGGGGLSAGRFGNAANFLPNQYYQISQSTTLRTFTALTVSAWFRPTALPQDNEDLFGGGLDGGPSRYALFLLLTPEGGATFNLYNDSSVPGSVPNPTTAVPNYLNNWHHFAATWDGAAVQVYVDGQPTLSGTFSGPLSVPTDRPLFINRHLWGGGSGSSSRLQGAIDDLAVFGRALAASEIAALATDGNANGIADFWDAAPPPTVTSSFFHFNEGSGTVASDAIGGHNGSISGATWQAGQSGTALNFGNPDTSAVAVPRSIIESLGNTVFAEAWIYPTARSVAPHSASIFTKRGAYNDWYFVVDPTGHVCCGLSGAGGINGVGVGACSTATVPLNQWSKVATSYDGATLRIHVNGLVDGSATQALVLDWDAPTCPGDQYYTDGCLYGIWIGATSTYSRTQVFPASGFKGIIDELRIGPLGP